MPECDDILALIASWLISVCGYCYVVSEGESLMYGNFGDEGTFKPSTEMLRRESKTKPLTGEVT